MAWTLRTPFTNARRRAWARRAQRTGELLYVAIGDSAAQGVGARDLDASYVGLLADALDRQLPALAALEPDLVTVAIGANDMAAYDPERFADEFGRLLAALPPHTIVADLPCFHFGPREQDAVRASRVIAELVHARRLAFAPLHRVTEKRRGRQSWAEFTWDQFHPSALGYRVWESAFAGAVAKRARALQSAS